MKEEKALSINQPWAWLIVNGFKDIENRDWATNHRGVFLVHAGKRFDHAGYDYIKRRFPNIPMPRPEDFAMGGIVGKASITGCTTQSQSKWFSGEYGFELSQQEPCDLIPCKGALGFFTPDYNSRYSESTRRKERQLSIFGGD